MLRLEAICETGRSSGNTECPWIKDFTAKTITSRIRSVDSDTLEDKVSRRSAVYAADSAAATIVKIAGVTLADEHDDFRSGSRPPARGGH